MVDITQRFLHARTLLTEGQLLHTEDFSLFDSMNAVELMDPKLDSGLALIQLDFQVSSSLTFEGVLGFADTQLRHLSLWLRGQSFLDTLLSCVFYQQPPAAIEHPVLRGLLFAFHYLGQSLHSFINTVTCLRDEDYAYSSLDYEAWTLPDEQAVLATLEVDAEPPLAKRVEFVKALVILVSSLSQGIDLTVLKPWTATAQALLAEIQAEPVTEPPAEVFNVKQSLLKLPHFMPEKVYDKAVHNTFTILSGFLSTFVYVEVLRNATSLDVLIASLENLPSFDILTRCLLEKIIFVVTDEGTLIFGRHSLQKMISKDMAKYGVNINRMKRDQHFLQYLSRTEIVWKEQILLRLKSQPKQRLILGKYFSDFNILIGEADYLECKMNDDVRPPLDKQMLFQWIYGHTVTAMLRYLHLGLQQELYTVEDLGMLMVYMDCLYGTLNNSRTTVLAFLSSKEGKKLKNKIDLNTLEEELHRTNTMQALCRAYVSLYFVLLKTGLAPLLSKSTEAARFHKRFAVFHQLSLPQKLGYETINALKSRNADVDTVVDACQKSLNEVKTAFSTTDRQLARVVVTNSFAVSKAKRAGWRCKVSLSWREHSIFPVCEVITS